MKTSERELPRILTGVGLAVLLTLAIGATTSASEQTWNQTYSEAKKLGEEGKWPEALRTAHLSLTKAERAFGSDSLNAAKSHTLVGDLWAERGKFMSAHMRYTRGISIREKILGPDHPSLVKPLTLQADLFATHGRQDQAAVTYTRALEICDANDRTHDPDLTGALVGLATIYRKQGKYDEAETLLTRVLDVCDTFGKYDRSLDMVSVRSFSELAEVHAARSRFALAAECYGKALTMLESGNHGNKLLTCSILTRLADAHEKRGSTALAKAYQRRAVALYSTVKGPTAALGLAELRP